jgi:hypothetical protein
MKTITLFEVLGTDLAKSNDAINLRNFANKMGHSDKPVTEVQVDWLDDGDKITISKCVGSSQDDDGISSGGKWVDITGTWHPLEAGSYAGEKSGKFLNENGDFVCIVKNDTQYNGFPYRNIRVATADTVADGSANKTTTVYVKALNHPVKKVVSKGFSNMDAGEISFMQHRVKSMHIKNGEIFVDGVESDLYDMEKNEMLGVRSGNCHTW